MECTECGYPLWNLRARECPECGQSFLPSEYRFVKNSVQFCCLNCDQPYYGTDEEGHLEPQRFNCVKCDETVEMNACVLRPTAGVRDEQTRVFEMAWLERKQSGKPVRAFFKTMAGSMGTPVRLVHAIGENRSDPGEAVWFAGLMMFLPYLLSVGILFLIVIGAGGGMAGSYACGGLVAVFLGMFFWYLLWVLTAHGILRLTGETVGTIGRTFEGVSYASGPCILSGIPCLGSYLVPVSALWWSIAAIFTLRERQQVSGLRASFAALSFPVLSFFGLIGGFVFFVSWSATFPGPMQGVTNQSQVRYMSRQLQAMVFQNEDEYPAHAADIFYPDWVDPIVISGWQNSSELGATQIPVGSGTFDDVIGVNADTDEACVLVLEAIDALPEDVVAHRLGSLVFTYHGIDPMDTNQDDLWVIVKRMTPSSPIFSDLLAHNPSWVPTGMVQVVDAVGFVQEIPDGRFAAELAAQNVLRGRFGLPALPDPDDVTYDAPATANSVTNDGDVGDDQ